MARAAWLLPCVALAALGLSDRAGVAVGAVALLAIVATAALGAAAAAVAKARGALVANIAVLLALGGAALAGARARGDAVVDAEKLHSELASAINDHDGWTGGGTAGAVRLVAFEIDARSELAARLPPGDGALVLVGVDNRAGVTGVELDLTPLAVRFPDGAIATGTAIAPASHHIPAGTARQEAFGRLSADMRNVAEMVVLVDGRPVVLRGRWLSAAQKHH